MELKNCPDCGAKPGKLHKPGCDVERCPLCGMQAIGCDCIYEHVLGMDCDLETDYPSVYKNGPTKKMEKTFDKILKKAGGRLPWTGEWPGVAECREYGLYSYLDKDRGWVNCTANHPEAGEDLNSIYHFFDWSAEKRKWVFREWARSRLEKRIKDLVLSLAKTT
jgi:hypothetical protein